MKVRVAVIVALLMQGALIAADADSAAKPAASAAGSPAAKAAGLAAALTLVSVHAHDTPTRDVLNVLLRDGGLPTAAADKQHLSPAAGSVRVTCDLVDQPFMLAMKEVCRLAYLEPVYDGAEARPLQRVQFAVRRADKATTRPSWVDAPACSHGPITFVALDATRISDTNLDPPDAPPNRRLQLHLLALADPRVRLVRIGSTLEIDQASDERGLSLLGPKPGDRPAADLVRDQGRWSWEITTQPMLYPPADSHTIALLRGRLRATVVTKVEKIAFDDLARPIEGERTVGGIRMRFGNVDGNGTRLALTVYRDNLPDPQWDEVRVGFNSEFVHATDAQGREFAASVQINPIGRNDAYQGPIIFRPPRWTPKEKLPPPTRPTKLVIDFPTEVEDIDVPAEFKDLPLP